MGFCTSITCIFYATCMYVVSHTHTCVCQYITTICVLQKESSRDLSSCSHSSKILKIYSVHAVVFTRLIYWTLAVLEQHFQRLINLLTTVLILSISSYDQVTIRRNQFHQSTQIQISNTQTHALAYTRIYILYKCVHEHMYVCVYECMCICV